MDDGCEQQHFCLKWNNYQKNMTTVFEQLRSDELFVDVTLACEGKHIKAHKVVLSACSPYLKSLLLKNPCSHPIVIMPRDVRYEDLSNVIQFVYRGEIDVAQGQLDRLLETADQLQIKGLCDVAHSCGGGLESSLSLPLGSPSVDCGAPSSPVATVSGSSPSCVLPASVAAISSLNRRKQIFGTIPPRKISPQSEHTSDRCESCHSAPPGSNQGNENFIIGAEDGVNNEIRHETGQLSPSTADLVADGSPASVVTNIAESAPLLASCWYRENGGPRLGGCVESGEQMVDAFRIAHDYQQESPLDLAAQTGTTMFNTTSPSSTAASPHSPATNSASVSGATCSQAYQAAVAASAAAAAVLSQQLQQQQGPPGACSLESDRKLWSEDSMERALESLRSQRMSLSKASATFGIPSTTLWQRAHKIGIETPKKEGSNKNWTESDLQLALHDLRAGKMSANKASKWYGIPNSTLYKIAKKEGIKLSAPFSNAQTSWRPVDLQRALAAIRAGKSVMRAGAEFGIPAGTLYGRCRRAGIELKTAGGSGSGGGGGTAGGGTGGNPGNPWSEHDMQHALYALRSGNMSINRAAQHFNLPYSSLYCRSRRNSGSGVGLGALGDSDEQEKGDDIKSPLTPSGDADSAISAVDRPTVSDS